VQPCCHRAGHATDQDRGQAGEERDSQQVHVWLVDRNGGVAYHPVEEFQRDDDRASKSTKQRQDAGLPQNGTAGDEEGEGNEDD